MRRKKALAIVLGIISLVIVLLGTIAVFYSSVVTGQPPQIVVKVNGNQYDGAQGSYCWSSFGQGKCVDYVAPSNRTDVPQGPVVPLNASISFDVISYFRPSMFHASLFREGSFVDLLNVDTTGSAKLNVPLGTYFLSVSASWSRGGDTSNVFKITVVGSK